MKYPDINFHIRADSPNRLNAKKSIIGRVDTRSNTENTQRAAGSSVLIVSAKCTIDYLSMTSLFVSARSMNRPLASSPSIGHASHIEPLLNDTFLTISRRADEDHRARPTKSATKRFCRKSRHRFETTHARPGRLKTAARLRYVHGRL